MIVIAYAFPVNIFGINCDFVWKKQSLKKDDVDICRHVHSTFILTDIHILFMSAYNEMHIQFIVLRSFSAKQLVTALLMMETCTNFHVNSGYSLGVSFKHSTVLGINR